MYCFVVVLTGDVVVVVEAVAVEQAGLGLHADGTVLSFFRQTQSERRPLPISSSSTRL